MDLNETYRWGDDLAGLEPGGKDFTLLMGQVEFDKTTMLELADVLTRLIRTAETGSDWDRVDAEQKELSVIIRGVNRNNRLLNMASARFEWGVKFFNTLENMNIWFSNSIPKGSEF